MSRASAARPLALLLVLAAPARADLVISQQQPANKALIILAASGSDAAGAGFIWTISPSAGVERDATPGRLAFTGPDGTYTVTLQAILWDKKQIIETTWTGTVGKPIPPPPPPAPPDPAQLAEPPYSAMRAAFPNPATAEDRANAAKLAAVYKAAATTTTKDPKLTTLGQFKQAVSVVAQGSVPLPLLQPARVVLANDLAQVVGADLNVPLTDELRKKLAARFLQYADIWSALGK